QIFLRRADRRRSLLSALRTSVESLAGVPVRLIHRANPWSHQAGILEHLCPAVPVATKTHVREDRGAGEVGIVEPLPRVADVAHRHNTRTEQIDLSCDSASYDLVILDEKNRDLLRDLLAKTRTAP